MVVGVFVAHKEEERAAFDSIMSFELCLVLASHAMWVYSENCYIGLDSNRMWLSSCAFVMPLVWQSIQSSELAVMLFYLRVRYSQFQYAVHFVAPLPTRLGEH